MDQGTPASAAFRRTVTLVCGALLLALAGCDRADDGVTPVKARSLEELRAELLSRKADIDLFRPRGPFAVSVRKDAELKLATGETVRADVYLSSVPARAPLLILVHGLENSKQDHAYQGMHVATWGIHAAVVDMPNRGPWIRNGNLLARLAQSIHADPALVDPRIDPERILLAGHSFGASAVAVALGREPSPAAGGILLDPAAVGRAIPGYLRKIHAPMVSIASDERVTLTLNRGQFYQHVPRDMTTASIRDASHVDAQFPVEPYPRSTEVEDAPVEALQYTYVSALTSAAISIGLTGGLDYAWESFSSAAAAGRMFGELRK